MDEQTINTTCLCGASKLSFVIPSSSLPLPAHLCHCETSRRISGTICTSYVAIPPSSSLSPQEWKDMLTPYRSSAEYDRHFCTTCGTHMVFENLSTGAMHIATGTIDAETSDNFVDFKGHMWIDFSKDGGASDFIRTLHDGPAQRWLVAPEKSEQAPQDWRSKSADVAAEAELNAIPLHCHCNRVQVRITRPNEASKSVFPAPDWPDLIIPAHSGRNHSNKYGVNWYLSKDQRRYLAGACTCRSCRLGTGFDIMSWSFIPLPNIEFPDGSAVNGAEDGLDADERIKSMLSVHKSTTRDGVKRYFCPDCGATAFWFSPQRPKLLDVAVALLDAPSGVRAETLFEWRVERVSYSEEALHKGLLRSLETGMKEWHAIATSKSEA